MSCSVELVHLLTTHAVRRAERDLMGAEGEGSDWWGVGGGGGRGEGFFEDLKDGEGGGGLDCAGFDDAFFRVVRGEEKCEYGFWSFWNWGDLDDAGGGVDARAEDWGIGFSKPGGGLMVEGGGIEVVVLDVSKSTSLSFCEEQGEERIDEQ